MKDKKEGIYSAWYKDSSLMFIEEYENDKIKLHSAIKDFEDFLINIK